LTFYLQINIHFVYIAIYTQRLFTICLSIIISQRI